MASRSPSSKPRVDDAAAEAPLDEHKQQSKSEASSVPTKRKSLSSQNGSTATTDAGAENNNNTSKKKRRKVNHACIYCRRSHMTCDLERPCARCVKRDIGHLCRDEVPDRNRSKSDGGGGVPDQTQSQSEENAGMGMTHTNEMQNKNVYSQSLSSATVAEQGKIGEGGHESGNSAASNNLPQILQPAPVSPTRSRSRMSLANIMESSSGDMPQMNFDWTNGGMHNQFQDMHHLHPNYMFSNAEVNSEYNLLNDFLSTSLQDDGAIFDSTQLLLDDPLLNTASMDILASAARSANPNTLSQQQPQLAPAFQPRTAGQDIQRPDSALPASEQSRNKFYMTAADPAGLSSAEERLRKLLQAKYDAGMLKPFNYVRGYARLNAYLGAHATPRGAMRIRRQLERFRPKFREAMQNLSDMQLVLVEMWFERSLLEYDRVFAAMAVPACCWRRTGEIFRGNREMAELIGVGWERLRDGRLAIHEIFAEDSLASYWEKFGAIAFDTTQKAILTSCSLQRIRDTGGGGSNQTLSRDLKKADGAAASTSQQQEDASSVVRCCFSFTIRRDTHNIPALIVGNFIPISPRTQAR